MWPARRPNSKRYSSEGWRKSFLRALATGRKESFKLPRCSAVSSWLAPYVIRSSRTRFLRAFDRKSADGRQLVRTALSLIDRHGDCLHAFSVNPPPPTFPATLSFQTEDTPADLTGNFP